MILVVHQYLEPKSIKSTKVYSRQKHGILSDLTKGFPNFPFNIKRIWANQLTSNPPEIIRKP